MSDTNQTPTTQAVEQLREEVEKRLDIAMRHARENPQSHALPMRKDTTNIIISALADTIKIVGGEIIGNEVTVNPHLGTVNPQEAQNRLRLAQRQRLELVVKEMKAK